LSEVFLNLNGIFLHYLLRDLNRKIALALYFVFFSAHEVLDTIPKSVLDLFDFYIFSFFDVTQYLEKVWTSHIEVAGFQSVDVEILKQKKNALLSGLFLSDLGILARFSVAIIDILPL